MRFLHEIFTMGYGQNGFDNRIIYSVSLAGATLSGRRTILFTGRVSLEAVVRTSTTRTCPSSPGWSASIRARGHLLGGVVSFLRRHRRPTRASSSTLFHFGRWASVFKYSRDHRCQKCSRIFCSICHRERRAIGSSTSDGSGTAFRAAPIRKWPGVSALRSSGSSDMA